MGQLQREDKLRALGRKVSESTSVLISKQGGVSRSALLNIFSGEKVIGLTGERERDGIPIIPMFFK